MKQTISKLALTLGLILMFGSSAWAGTATYIVKCTVDGTEVTMGANTYGYTINTTYRSSNGGRAGVENGTNNSESLPVRSRKDNDSAPTASQAAGYITANSVNGYTATITGSGTTITIAYTKQVKTQNYTVKCTLNGADQTMDGTFGYTVKKAYPANDDAVSTEDDATTLTMSKNGTTNPTAISGTNYSTYITPRTVTMHNETCTVSVSVSGAGTKTLTIAYTGPKEYTITSIGAPAGVTFEWKLTTGEVVGNKLYTSVSLTNDNLASYIALNGFDADKYVVVPSVNGTNITYTFNLIKTYPVTIADGAPAGAGFTVKNGATKDGNSIIVAANLTAQNVGDYVEAVTVSGYDAVIGWDGTNVTVTYVQLYTTDYTVVCTLGGETHALDNTYGYTVKKAYSATSEGITTGKNANPLVMQKRGETPTALTNDNIADFITPIANTSYDATASVEGTTITIAYVVKPAESNTWTVTCTLNGTTQTMNGTYGYTVKTAYNGSNTGIYVPQGTSKDDATSFTMRGAANVIDSITNANYTQFITVRQVPNTQVRVQIRRDHTIRIVYDNRYDYFQDNLCYKITSTANKEVSVSLANYDATSVTVPRTVVINGETYNVTSIANRGFTDAYASDNNKIYPINEDHHPWCNFTSNTDHTTVNKSNTEASTTYDKYSRWCKGYNANLEEITFEQPCQIKTIGNGAFMGCVNLKSFISPLSVETYGKSVFMGCKNLTTFKFETNDDGLSNLTALPDSAFYGCQSIGTLRIPEGITSIGSNSLKYLLKLTSITLPSTLETIGSEFLCTSLSLETLTLPASVTSMGGGSFHGCNALRSVYLLGPASALDKGSGSNETFMANNAFCADGVNNCTFYTTSAYIDDFKASNWKIIDGEVDPVTGEATTAPYNRLVAEIPGQKRGFTPGKWATFCLPQSKIFFEFDGTTISPTPGNQGEVSVKARPAATASASVTIKKDVFENGWVDGTTEYDGFGVNCKVAKLVEATLDENDFNLYHAKYQLIDHSEIKPYIPYLILPEIPVDQTGAPITDGDGKFPNLNICLWNELDEVNGLTTGWNAAQTAEHVFSIRCTKDDKGKDAVRPATIQWIAQISRSDRLYPGDIYFKSNDNVGLVDKDGKIIYKYTEGVTSENVTVQEVGKFYIVPSDDVKVTLKTCSAFWRILQDGISSTGVKMASGFNSQNIDPAPNGIEEIENDKPIRIVVDGIYDMSGRKLDVDQSQLPEGMYIMNGKKVLKK